MNDKIMKKNGLSISHTPALLSTFFTHFGTFTAMVVRVFGTFRCTCIAYVGT